MSVGRARYRYTVRTVSIPEGEAHDCSGRIVATLAATYSVENRKWYLTALVERPIEEAAPTE